METEKQYVYTSLKDLKLKYFPEIVEIGLGDQEPKQQIQTLDLLKDVAKKKNQSEELRR